MSGTTPAGILNPQTTTAMVKELREQFTKRRDQADHMLRNTECDDLAQYRGIYTRAKDTQLALEDFETIVGKHERK